MAIKKRVNKIAPCFENHSFYVMGQPKSGKTSLFYEAMLLHYEREDAGLLIPFEMGYGHLSVAVATTEDDYGNIKTIVEDWDDFVEIVDDLVENRYTDHKDVKCIGLDTVGTLVEYSEAESIRISNKRAVKKGKPKVDTIGEAWDGYQRGQKYARKLVAEQIARLRGCGYGMWMLGHTKVKTIKRDGELVGHDELTSDLESGSFMNIAKDTDFIVMITNENTVKGDKIVSTQRNIRFNGDGFYVAGSRFSKFLPDTIEYNIFDFLKTYDDAVMKAGNFTKEQLIEERVKHEKKMELKSKKYIKEDKKNVNNRKKEELGEDLESIYKRLPKTVRESVTAKMNELNSSTFEEFKEALGLEQLESLMIQLKGVLGE